MARSDTRQAIIEAAVRLFADKGFEKTTVDEVAAKARVAKGTVFYNFKNKEDIFFTILQKGIDDLVEITRNHVSKGGTPTEKLEAVYDSSAKFLQKYSNFQSVLVSELGRVRSRWNMDPIKLLDPYRQIIEDILTEGQKTGEFREDIESQEIGLIIIMAVLGSGLGRMITTGYQDHLDGAARRIFLRGLKKEKAL